MNVRWLLDLCRAVHLLALDSESQVGELVRRALSPSADELGLLFEDAFQMVPQLRDAGALTAEETALLAELNDCLDRISDWEVSFLDSPSWVEARTLARRFLTSPSAS